MNKEDSFKPIVDYIDAQYEAYLQEELKIKRNLSRSVPENIGSPKKSNTLFIFIQILLSHLAKLLRQL